MSAEPVSYTHLDVYKRQSISCSKYLGTGFPDFTAIAICFSRNLLITDSLFFGFFFEDCSDLCGRIRGEADRFPRPIPCRGNELQPGGEGAARAFFREENTRAAL